jgi:hypothetical protein
MAVVVGLVLRSEAGVVVRTGEKPNQKRYGEEGVGEEELAVRIMVVDEEE